jgi:hypothetical protein
MTRQIRRSTIWAAFESIRIEHPRVKEAYRTFDDLRQLKLEHSNAPQRFVSIFAPSHSGKSMAAQMYIETKIVEEAIRRKLFPADTPLCEIARRQRLVLHVTLSASATPKSLASDILMALGDKRAERGTATGLLARSYDLMQAVGTELLIVDEIQHLSPTRGRKNVKIARAFEQSTSVTDTLKTMMIRGLVPMVFIGVNEARHLLFNDEQLANRRRLELDFGCLNYGHQRERKIFEYYCAFLGAMLREQRLFRSEVDLLTNGVAACLHAVSGGRIGLVSRLVERAAVIALDDDATTISTQHLERATIDWAIPRGLIDYNPFKLGIRRIEKRVS